MRIRRWRLPMAILAAIGVCPLWVTRVLAQGPNIAVNANGATMCIVRGDGPADEKVDQNGNGSSNTLYSYNDKLIDLVNAGAVHPMDNWVPFDVEYGGSWPRSIKGQFSMPSHYLWTPNESQDNWRTGTLETHPAANFSEINGNPSPFPVTATSGDQKSPQTQMYSATPPNSSTSLTSTYTLTLHDPVEYRGPVSVYKPINAFICWFINVGMPDDNNENETQPCKFEFTTEVAQAFGAQIGKEMLKLTGTTTFTIAGKTTIVGKVPPHKVRVAQIVIRCNSVDTPVTDWDVAGNRTPGTEVMNTAPYTVMLMWSSAYSEGRQPTD